MLEEFNRIVRLIIKYYEDREGMSAEDERELYRWRVSSKDNEKLFERFADPEYVREQLLRMQESDKHEAWDRILETIYEEESIESDAGSGAVVVPVSRIRKRRSGWIRYAAVAALLTLMAIGAWYWNQRSKPVQTAMVSKYGNDAMPGSNKATLTLGDGSKIALTAMSNGTIAMQGNTKIEKLDSGRLAYDPSSTTTTETVFNTLTTPPAGQFRLVLPDGSRVWLNNASSLRYPTTFTGNDREVELHGEAFFEVAKNEQMPFKVKIDDMTIDVLGTSFNVMAYGDEATQKTTLVSGAVKVEKGKDALVLKPGEQAALNVINGDLRLQKDVDVDGVVAWKNGLFHFERSSIREVMRTLARWYDMKVEYEGPVTDHLYGGDIQRDLKLSQVLDILQKNQVHFSIDNKIITVRP